MNTSKIVSIKKSKDRSVWKAIEWPDLAKYVSELLVHIPDGPNLIVEGLLSANPGSSKISPNPPVGYPKLEETLDKLLRVGEYINRYVAATEVPDFSKHDGKAAISAYAYIRWIVDRRYADPLTKRELPIDVAGIVRTVSAANTANAKNHRKTDRRSALAKAVSTERCLDRFASAAEVLDRLCGGDVVKEFRNERVYYWDKDVLKDIGLDRFETIFSEQKQKPSTG